MKVLTIISHTEHYMLPDGTIVGLGSTVTEINHLLKVFDEINHVAMLHKTKAPPSALPYASSKIKFIPIEALGGPDISDKISILWQAPKVLQVIRKALKNSDFFQFRAPTGIGVFVIPYLIFFSSKKGWFKYAGNWNQKNGPISYRFQKWLFEHQNRKVTINGVWPNQPDQCLTFENPCLSNVDIEKGNKVVLEKAFNNQYVNFCFVGRLEKEKGIDLLINAFKTLNESYVSRIGVINIVGYGPEIKSYKESVKGLKLNFQFHGFLSREEVHDIYIKSNAIILPSASEGFPKVIAEALNYGCLPIVSNVSGISHYIKDGKNGFLLNTLSVNAIISKIVLILSLDADDYLKMLKFEREHLEKFTFDYYNSRVNNELIL